MDLTYEVMLLYPGQFSEHEVEMMPVSKQLRLVKIAKKNMVIQSGEK